MKDKFTGTENTEVMLTAISSKGNPVERFGRVDKVTDTGVTIELLDRDAIKPQYRAVRFDQITEVVFL